jgi:hypothetical protein
VLALATLCAATATWVRAADMPDKAMLVMEAMMRLESDLSLGQFTQLTRFGKCCARSNIVAF